MTTLTRRAAHVYRRPLVLGLLAGGMGLLFLIGLATTLAAAQQSQIYY